MFNRMHDAYVNGRDASYSASNNGRTYNPTNTSASTARDTIRNPSGTLISRAAPASGSQSAFNITTQTVIIRANSIIQESEGLQNSLSDDALSSIFDLLGGEGSIDEIINGISSILQGSASSAGASGLAEMGAGVAEAGAVGAGAAEDGAPRAAGASGEGGAAGAGDHGAAL